MVWGLGIPIMLHGSREADEIAFDPADISGLVVRLRADVGVTLVSGRVSNWADQSGEGNDFVQGTAGNRPLWTASGVNGQPTVDFDKTRPDLLSLANLPGATDGYPGLTFILIFSYTANAGYGMWMSMGAVEELRESSGGLMEYVSNTGNATSASSHAATWGMATGRNNESDNLINVSWNTTQDASGGPTGVANPSDNPVTLGGRAAGSQPVTMSVAEFLIYSRALTNGERDQIYNDYAVARYAI